MLSGSNLSLLLLISVVVVSSRTDHGAGLISMDDMDAMYQEFLHEFHDDSHDGYDANDEWMHSDDEDEDNRVNGDDDNNIDSYTLAKDYYVESSDDEDKHHMLQGASGMDDDDNDDDSDAKEFGFVYRTTSIFVFRLASYQDAEDYCQGVYGTNLVTIGGQQKNRKLTRLLLKLSKYRQYWQSFRPKAQAVFQRGIRRSRRIRRRLGNGNVKSWIGLNTKNEWNSGSTSDFRNYSQRRSSKGRCTVLAANGKWLKRPCKQRNFFYCDNRGIPKPGRGTKNSAGRAGVSRKVRYLTPAVVKSCKFRNNKQGNLDRSRSKIILKFRTQVQADLFAKIGALLITLKRGMRRLSLKGCNVPAVAIVKIGNYNKKKKRLTVYVRDASPMEYMPSASIDVKKDDYGDNGMPNVVLSNRKSKGGFFDDSDFIVNDENGFSNLDHQLLQQHHDDDDDDDADGNNDESDYLDAEAEAEADEDTSMFANYDDRNYRDLDFDYNDKDETAKYLDDITAEEDDDDDDDDDDDNDELFGRRRRGGFFRRIGDGIKKAGKAVANGAKKLAQKVVSAATIGGFVRKTLSISYKKTYTKKWTKKVSETKTFGSLGTLTIKANGAVTFKAGVDFLLALTFEFGGKWSVLTFKIPELRAIITLKHHLIFNFYMKIVADVAATLKFIEIGPKTPITIMVGPLPVVFRPFLKPYLGFTAKTLLEFNMDVGYNNVFFQFGFKMINGKFQSVKNVKTPKLVRNWSLKNGDGTCGIKIDFNPFIGAEFLITMYGTFTVGADIRVNGNMWAALPAPVYGAKSVCQNKPSMYARVQGNPNVVISLIVRLTKIFKIPLPKSMRLDKKFKLVTIKLPSFGFNFKLPSILTTAFRKLCNCRRRRRELMANANNNNKQREMQRRRRLAWLQQQH